MEISSAFDPFPFTDHTHFFNTIEEDEEEFQLFVDATFAEQLQLEEALKASLLPSQIPPPTTMLVETTAESSLRFCHCCNKRKENDQLNKTQKCGHFVCLDCSLLNMGKCPVLDCEPAVKSDTFKQFLPKDLIFLWEKAPSSDPIPNMNCRNGFGAKMDPSSTKLITPRRKYKEANASNALKKIVDSGRDKWLTQADNCVKNKPPLVITSSPAAKSCPKWEGLKDEKRDREIIWPPMVVISYTMHTMDENSMLIGMTNQEIMEMFSSYDGIAKAQQCYYIDGYFEVSVLVFESSVMGYLEAERLHKYFSDQGTDRNAWNSRSVHFLPSSEKQLYGYLALKEDVDTFNRFLPATSQLKYEMKSYLEMVVNKIKQMYVKNHELVFLRKRVHEHEKQVKEYEESCGKLKQKLKLAKEEADIMRRKVTEQHEQHMEEVECQEQFYREQIRSILVSRKGKEKEVEVEVEVQDPE